MVNEAELEKLRLTVARRQIELDEARKVFDVDNQEPRLVKKLRRAEDLLYVAQGELARAQGRLEQAEARIVAEEERQRLRAPPDLQKLVLDWGGYDKVPEPVWNQFEDQMAKWKAKLRNGEFPSKIW